MDLSQWNSASANISIYAGSIATLPPSVVCHRGQLIALASFAISPTNHLTATTEQL